VGIIDERGTFINQLQVMALLMMYLVEKRGQKGDVVRSLTSTSMVDKLGERFGVTVHELKVGFKYIGPKMAETNAMLGGEESGGFAFRGHIPERDGILSGITFADMIVKYGQPLSKIMEHLTELVDPTSTPATTCISTGRSMRPAGPNSTRGSTRSRRPRSPAPAWRGRGPMTVSSTTSRTAAGCWFGSPAPSR